MSATDPPHIRRAKIVMLHKSFYEKAKGVALDRALADDGVYLQLLRIPTDACESTLDVFLQLRQMEAQAHPLPEGEGAPEPIDLVEPEQIARRAMDLVVMRNPQFCPSWTKELAQGIDDPITFTDNAILHADLNAIRADLQADARETLAFVTQHGGSWPRPEVDDSAELSAAFECVHMLFRHVSSKIVKRVIKRNLYLKARRMMKTNDEANAYSANHRIDELLKAQADKDPNGWFLGST